MSKVVIMTFNAKYIHKALALRWLYVARDPQFDTEIVEYTIRDEIERCVDDMVARNPDVIACSTYIWNVEMMKQWILLIKKQLPKVRIILGGPEVSFECEEWLDYPIECVLRGEGEQTLWQAIRQEEEIDGYYSSHYKSKISYAKVPISYLEKLESPYFLQIDSNDMDKRYFYFETSRGCPFRCTYCLSSVDNQVRHFSWEYIKEQLDKLETIRVKQVKLLDRTFNSSDEISYRFLRYLENLKCNCSFQFEIVVDRLSEEVLNFLIHDATVAKYRFEVGVQSFQQKTLKAVERYQNLEKTVEVISKLTEKGYELHTDLIAGLPYETMVLFEDSFNQLFNTKTREIQVGILKLLKGTKMKYQKDTYQIVYDVNAPYSALSTAWMAQSDFDKIECVYKACERLYNSGRCYNSLHTLSQLGVIESPFQVLLECGQLMSSIKQIQVKDYFLILYKILLKRIKDVDLIQAILMSDYYRLFKQRPQPIFKDTVEESIRKKMLRYCVDANILSENIAFNYTAITKGYYNQNIAIQLLVYSSKHSLSKRIWFNIDLDLLHIENIN